MHAVTFSILKKLHDKRHTYKQNCGYIQDLMAQTGFPSFLLITDDPVTG